MNTSKCLQVLLFAGSAALALVSCGGGDGGISLDPGAFEPGGSTETFPTGNVVGTVTSAADSSAVVAAAVTSGAASTTSMANGRWGLNLNDASRAVALVRATAYAENVRVFAVAGLPVNVPAPLVPLGNATAVNVAAGGIAAQTGTAARISLPANALVPPAGATASASVDVRVTELRLVQNLNVVPGDYTTLDGQGNQVAIEAFGVVQVTASDAAGARYAMAANQVAALRIPAATRGVTPPNTLPLMYLDEATGRWVQTANNATLNGDFYEGNVGRLGFWAVAQPQQIVTLTGCVNDPAGQPVANARVILEGTDYNAVGTTLSAANGTFSMPLRAGRTATVTAQAGGAVSNTVAITATQSAANFTLATCLRTSGSANGISIKLSWGGAPADLDSHLFTPNGAHVYWVDRGSLTGGPFAALDVDDVDGSGPEVVTVVRLFPGTYRYAVYNYSGSFTPGMTGSPTRIELTRAGFTTVYAPPAGEGQNRWWRVFDIVVDSQCRVTIRNAQSWQTASPVAVASSSQPCN